MFCEKCGQKCDTDANFCKYCGYSLSQFQEPEKISEPPKSEPAQNEPMTQPGEKADAPKKALAPWLVSLFSVLTAVFVGTVLALIVALT